MIYQTLSTKLLSKLVIPVAKAVWNTLANANSALQQNTEMFLFTENILLFTVG